MATDPRVKRGAIFRHARHLDPDWTPGPGQRYADAPKRVMEISRTSDTTVWYRPVGTDGRWLIGRENFDNVVGEWL